MVRVAGGPKREKLSDFLRPEGTHDEVLDISFSSVEEGETEAKESKTVDAFEVVKANQPNERFRISEEDDGSENKALAEAIDSAKVIEINIPDTEFAKELCRAMLERMFPADYTKLEIFTANRSELQERGKRPRVDVFVELTPNRFTTGTEEMIRIPITVELEYSGEDTIEENVILTNPGVSKDLARGDTEQETIYALLIGKNAERIMTIANRKLRKTR